MSRDFRYCTGLDLRCCETCKRNLDNYPTGNWMDVAPMLTPAADPPKCADWSALGGNRGRPL